MIQVQDVTVKGEINDTHIIQDDRLGTVSSIVESITLTKVGNLPIICACYLTP